MPKNSTNSIREFNALILKSETIIEIQEAKKLLMQDLESFSVEDQGFLLTMIGIRILKLVGGYENLDRTFCRRTCSSFLKSNDN